MLLFIIIFHLQLTYNSFELENGHTKTTRFFFSFLYVSDNDALDFKIRGTLASGKANVTMTCSDYYKSHVYGVAFKKGKTPLVHVNNSTGLAWLDPHYMKRVKTEVHSLRSGNVKVSLTLSKITCNDEGRYECEILRIPSSKSIQKYFRILCKY